MPKYQRVLFVSESGNSRAMIASAIFNKKAYGSGIKAEARGTVVLFPEPGNPKAVAIAKNHGIDLTGFMSSALKEDEFGDDVLVLTMTERRKFTIYEDYKNAKNVYSIREFADVIGEPQDPYGGDLTEYGAFYEDMEKTIDEIISKINKNEEE